LRLVAFPARPGQTSWSCSSADLIESCPAETLRSCRESACAERSSYADWIVPSDRCDVRAERFGTNSPRCLRLQRAKSILHSAFVDVSKADWRNCVQAAVFKPPHTYRHLILDRGAQDVPDTSTRLWTAQSWETETVFPTTACHKNA